MKYWAMLKVPTIKNVKRRMFVSKLGAMVITGSQPDSVANGVDTSIFQV